MTSRALLEMPHLSLELVGGASGLDRPIAWAHVAEVSDPTPWLEGGELILTTGLGMTAAPEEQLAYLSRLRSAQVAGIVVVSDSAPPISGAMIAAADEQGLPLLTTMLKQPFQAIGKLVYAANSSAEAERLVEHLRIYGVLRTAATETIAAAQLVQRLGDLTRTSLAVVRQDGRPQFGAGNAHHRWPEAAVALEELSGSARRGTYARLTSDDGAPPGFVVQVSAPTPSRVFLIVEGADPGSTPDLVAVHHIATVVGTQVVAQRAERAVRQRVGADLLRELIDGYVGPSVTGRLSALELPDDPLVVLYVRPRQRESDVSAERLHDVLLDHDMPALVGSQLGDVVAVLPADHEPASMARGLRRLATDALEQPCAVSAGTPGDCAHIRTSFQQAVVTIEHAELASDGIATFGRIDEPLAWMMADPARTELLVAQTIAPLIAYDREHRSELVLTLSVYLRATASPSQAADALHVHRNTLSYRLRRIEELTGRSLASMDDRFELWLGLRAQELARA
jgi:purine catabolism regulator